MIYVLYHDNCFDGHTAAWSAWLKFGADAKYIGCSHGSNPPEIEYKKDDIVYIVDFSFKKEILLDIKSKVQSLVVIDHHKTAEEDLKGLDFCIFNMQKSGALLTFEYFFPNDEVPKLVRYISDRDLWKFELPSSKEIHAFIASYAMTFENWNELNNKLDMTFEIARDTGVALLRAHDIVVDMLCKHNLRFDKFKMGDKTITLPVINAPKQFGSDACVKLYELCNTPAAVYYIVESDKVIYGIRSRPDFDCSVIAKSYGGGGHKNASGWQMPL